MDHVRILGRGSDPEVVAHTPGVYMAPSSSPSYGVLKGLVDVGAAQFLGEAYQPDGALAVAVAVKQPKRNAAGQITIGSEFFISALRDYGDWPEKWWREAIQNSVDGGATEIDCIITFLDAAGKAVDNFRLAHTIEVSCQDNGRGMDEETLLTKFLVLGGSTKQGAAGTVGGFGKAKELLLLPWIRWHLHSRNLLVEGHGIEYEVKHLPSERQGTGLTVWMPPDRYAGEVDALSFLKKCWIPGVRFTVNGNPVRANLKVGQTVETLPGKLDITYKKSSKDFDRAVCLVRSRGLYMFDRWISSDAKGVVIAEITGSSVELLTANRDSLRDYDCRHALDEYINRLAADVKSATKGARNIVKKKFAGTGKFQSKPEQVEATMLVSIGSVEPYDPGGNRPKVLSTEQTQIFLRVLADYGSPDTDAGGGLDLRANAVAVEAMLDVPVLGAAHVEAIVRQLAWEPDFYVYNEIEEFHVPKKLMPDAMTPQVQKLARFWAELCRFVLIQLGSKQKYGVGWHFDRAEDGGYTAASYVSDSSDEHWLMLNPFVGGDPEKGELYSLSDRDHVNWLYAAAIHECTHMADGVSRHNEAFASALTRNIARTANRGRQIEAIRKTVVARGARVGKLAELTG